MSQDLQGKRRGRFLPYVILGASLCCLLLVVGVIGGLAHYLKPTIRDTMATARLHALGGTIIDGSNYADPNHYGISFIGASIADSDLAILRDLRQPDQIVTIYLNKTAITDQGLTHLQVCRNLSHVEVSETRVTDAGLANLKPLKKLTDLAFENTAITDAGVGELQEFGDLRRLILKGTAITDSGLASLRPLLALDVVNLEDTNVTLAGLRKLKRDIPDIRFLTFSETKALGFPRLEALHAAVYLDKDLFPYTLDLTKHIAGKAFDDAALAGAGDLSHMTQLVLDNTQITGASADLLKTCPRLIWLTLENTKVDDRVLEAIRGFDKLEHLRLAGTEVTDAGLAHVATLSSLRELDLRGTKVTSQGLRHLRALQSLYELDLSQTPIDDDGLESLGFMGKLETLKLRDTNVTDSGVVYLHGLRDPVVIDLTNTRVTEDAIRELKERYPHSGIPH